ncbi:MAG: tRNA pseudouridine synthase B [Leptospiraceae bacterium]|nr:MAG: tRNA pseudouridine synthase B [Leptospiraceae bacterium]
MKKESHKDLLNSILFLNKPSGITSAEAIQKVRENIKRKFHINPKIGHTGTLDKFAEGLLILLSGKATSFSEYFLKKNKTYLAEIIIGKQTDTLDPEGNIIEEWDKETIKDFILKNKEDIIKEIHNFIYQTEQTPPEYSAIKIAGKRASDWTREGKTIELPVKKIQIYQSEVIQIFDDGRIIAKFHVSSGTYIRSIARDLGKNIHAPAYLNRLQRISIGKWSLFDPYVCKIDSPYYIFSSILDILDDWGKLVVSIEWEKKIQHGQKLPIDLSMIPEENFFFINRKNKILAWAKKIDDKNYIYKKVFTTE